VVVVVFFKGLTHPHNPQKSHRFEDPLRKLDTKGILLINMKISK